VTRRMSWALLAVVLVGALAIGAQGDSGPVTEDQRVERISSVVRCPTCRGLSAAQSDAPSAEAIRDEVRRRVQAGESDGQIKDYLISRYGEDILLRRRRVGPGRTASADDEALVAKAMMER
jgi:cytochrome c-type biogenesis protein CcmH